jgi:hypothetical protein
MKHQKILGGFHDKVIDFIIVRLRPEEKVQMSALDTTYEH